MWLIYVLDNSSIWGCLVYFNIGCVVWFQVPAVYEEMILSRCTPDRKARAMLRSALKYMKQTLRWWMIWFESYRIAKFTCVHLIMLDLVRSHMKVRPKLYIDIFFSSFSSLGSNRKVRRPKPRIYTHKHEFKFHKCQHLQTFLFSLCLMILQEPWFRLAIMQWNSTSRTIMFQSLGRKRPATPS